MWRFLTLLIPPWLWSCAPSEPLSEERPALEPPTLVLLRSATLPLGERLHAELCSLPLPFEERPPSDPLFSRAFASAGGLGLVWIDGEGGILSTLAGYAPAGEIRARDRLVRRCADAWYAASPVERIRLQLELRAEVPARHALQALLAAPTASTPSSRAEWTALLAHTLARQGEVRSALDACEQALALDPAVATRAPFERDLCLARGLARLGGRDPRGALAELAGIPGPEAALVRGLALHAAGREEALSEFQTLLSRYPHTPWLPEVRRAIEHILTPPKGHGHP